MSTLFGIFDPDGQLTHRTVLERMARAMVKAPRSEIAIEFNALGCIGISCPPGSGEARLGTGPHGEIHAQLGRAVRREDAESAAVWENEPSGRTVRELRGHFALASLDPRRAKLTLASDHFGGRPVYIYRHGGLVLFASQLKGILAALDRRWRLDPLSVSSMLSFGELIGNRSLIDGISTLPAATLFTVGRAGATSTSYWQYEHHPDRRLRWGDAVEDIGRALKLAVGRALAGKGEPAVPLSGGLDSRLILELAARSSRPSAYTWGVPGCRDIRFADAAARRLGCRHLVFHFDPGYLAELGEQGVWITEGHTPATNFHVLPFVERLGLEGHDVLLDGFAGDVLLGGNFIGDAWLQGKDPRRAAAAIWEWRRRSFTGGRDFQQLAAHAVFARENFISLFLRYPGATPMDRAMAFLTDNRLRRTTLCGSELFRSRLPVRQPFMDPDLVAAISRVPHAWRRRHRLYLAVFAAHAPKSAAAPYLRTLLPVGVPYALTWLSLAAHRAGEALASRLGMAGLFADKAPSDFPAWLRGPLQNYVRDILASDRCLQRGSLPPEVVRRVLEEHFAGSHNHASLIGAMLSLELFARLFLDDLPGSAGRFSDALPKPAQVLVKAA